jgi:tetratricopeptide (TPR) repeat protein
MTLSSILPPSDLLDKVRGVEAGLRQRKRLSGASAFFSLLTSAVYLAVALEKDLDSFEKILTKTFTEPGLLLPAVVFIFSSLVLTWSRFWLREARQPFRYTCSIGTFEPITTGAPSIVATWMTWMSHDVTLLLNDRVQRFFFGDAPHVDPDIHVYGHWVVRNRADADSGLEIEVMPRVRLRQANGAEVMAQSTVLPLGDMLDRKSYEELLEQVYHSIVTQVYQQLEEDVRAKIELLPTTRHRAIALLYEADDYARSNSLHAYEEAKELYEQAAAMADPHWLPPRRTSMARLYRSVRCVIYQARASVRRVEALYRPSVQELDLLGARAMNGYGRMLVLSYILKPVIGKSADPPYEARPVAALAARRLSTLSRDVVGHAAVSFDVQVTLALAAWCVSDMVGGAAALRMAARIDPRRAEEDPVCLLASAVLTADRRTRLGLLRRAVERDPRFEVAQSWLAQETEMLWRARVPFERNGADHSILEYEKVRRLNPRNLSGYANAAYVNWLIGENGEARKLLEQALRLTTSRKDLFVAELDYGLARVKAEAGDLPAAYRHYVDAVSVLSLGLHRGDFRSYFFGVASRPLEQRFRTYYLNVRKWVSAVSADDADLARISKSILAFALNDLGEAHLYRAGYPQQRSYDGRCARLGVETLRRANRMNPNLLLPYGTLAAVAYGDERTALLEKGRSIEPRWPLGALMRAWDYATAEGDEPSRKRSQARAIELIRPMLPHEWLWKNGTFDWTAVTNKTFRRERRWERECNEVHAWSVQILALCHARDRGLSTVVWEHLREHFWPSDSVLLANLVSAKLSEPKSKRRIFAKATPSQTDIIDRAIAINPITALALTEVGVWPEKAQIIDADEAAARMSEEYRESIGFKERRGEMYAALARRLKNTAAVSDVFTPLYDEAMEVAARAVALHPKHQEELEQLQWMRQFGVAALLTLRATSRFVIDCSPQVGEAAAELAAKDVSPPDSFRTLGIPFPRFEIKRSSNVPHYHITIEGVRWYTRDVPAASDASPVEQIVADLEVIAREHPEVFLRLDDVLRLLNDAEPECGDRLRDDRLLTTFTAVVRTLAGEGISIRNPAVIVHAFRAVHTPGVAFPELMQQVRRHPGIRRRVASLAPAVVGGDVASHTLITDGLRKSDVEPVEPPPAPQRQEEAR